MLMKFSSISVQQWRSPSHGPTINLQAEIGRNSWAFTETAVCLPLLGD